MLKAIAVAVEFLKDIENNRESNTLEDVLEICRQPIELGGLGITESSILTREQESEIIFLASAWLEALNSADRAQLLQKPLNHRPNGRRGMTLSEKIFAMHDIKQKGFVAPGELIRIHVDWVIASEASWAVRSLLNFHIKRLHRSNQKGEREWNERMIALGSQGSFETIVSGLLGITLCIRE